MDETYGTYVDDECFGIHDYDDDTDHDTDDETDDETDDDTSDDSDDDTWALIIAPGKITYFLFLFAALRGVRCG